MTLLSNPSGLSDPSGLPRRWKHFSGAWEDCLAQAQAYVQAQIGVIGDIAACSEVLWISSSPLIPQALAAKKAHTVLGQEYAVLVFDAFSGFDVNAFAAVTGTLRGGGVLVILTPPLSTWANFADPDYQRFLPWPYTPDQVEGHFLKRLLTMWLAESPPKPSFHQYHNTQAQHIEQKQVVHTLLHATTTIVLSADRGRGKSAALGMAASQLIEQGKTVLVSAPAKAAVQAVFRHAQYAPGFFAPDDLLQRLPPADVLMVDEAAAIPVPLLLNMLQHYPRCVFATTLHGYEGSGRGFVLRFQNLLDEYVGSWQALRLHKPRRWLENDPLEQWVNQVLLLNVELNEALGEAGLCLDVAACHYARLERDALLADESLLREVFGLLVNAHYQTRPSDLRQLLDAPNVSVHALQHAGQLVAVALLSREGGLDAELTAAIHAGKRRPHGHLLPQTLTFHVGIAGAAELVCERILRIAVHPTAQGQGLGSLLLQHLLHYASEHTMDYIGVSYALTPKVRDFWEKAGFRTARIGFRRDTASGARSIVQLLPLNKAGETLMRRVSDKNSQQKCAQ